jgi:hypothetical protein
MSLERFAHSPCSGEQRCNLIAKEALCEIMFSHYGRTGGEQGSTEFFKSIGANKSNSIPAQALRPLPRFHTCVGKACGWLPDGAGLPSSSSALSG